MNRYGASTSTAGCMHNAPSALENGLRFAARQEGNVRVCPLASRLQALQRRNTQTHTHEMRKQCGHEVAVRPEAVVAVRADGVVGLLQGTRQFRYLQAPSSPLWCQIYGWPPSTLPYRVTRDGRLGVSARVWCVRPRARTGRYSYSLKVVGCHCRGFAPFRQFQHCRATVGGNCGCGYGDTHLFNTILLG